MGRRLFHANLPSGGGCVQLSDEVAHHARVLRLRVGDFVVLFDGEGHEAQGRLERAEAGAFWCDVGCPGRAESSAFRIVLVQAWPKAAKADGIVRAASELGVHAVHFAISERSQMLPGQAVARLARLERIAVEAARQSGRSEVARIEPPAPLLQVAGRAPPQSSRWLFWEEATSAPARQVAECEVWVAVGPEGGFSRSEATALGELGYVPVRFGRTILRVETAAVAAVTLALDRLL